MASDEIQKRCLLDDAATIASFTTSAPTVLTSKTFEDGVPKRTKLTQAPFVRPLESANDRCNMKTSELIAWKLQRMALKGKVIDSDDAAANDMENGAGDIDSGADTVSVKDVTETTSKRSSSKPECKRSQARKDKRIARAIENRMRRHPNAIIYESSPNLTCCFTSVVSGFRFLVPDLSNRIYLFRSIFSDRSVVILRTPTEARTCERRPRRRLCS